MKFKCIVIDPPWKFEDKLTMSDVKRGAESQYSVLSNEQIADIDIASITDPNGSILVLWVPSPLLDVGLKTMQSYGFKYKQTYIWNKIKKEPFKKIYVDVKKIFKNSNSNKEFSANLTSVYSKFLDDFGNNILQFGMGHLFRQTHELALIGINNNKVYKNLLNRSQRSVSFAPNLKHSSKPEHVQNSLDIMFDGPKLEIFARRQKNNWVCIGNEAPMTLSEDINTSIDKLKKASFDDFIRCNNNIITIKKYWNSL